MKGKNYSVPALVFELGTVLEAAIAVGGKIVVVHEWRGMRLLSDRDAFDRAHPRLYLVRAKPLKAELPEGVTRAALTRAMESYERWTERDPTKVQVITTGIAREPHGTLVRLDYRSDKWHAKGKTTEYTHDFTEYRGKGPKVFADAKKLERARTVVCSGGTMRITKGGIA